ncbi:quinone oxidoreductase family protein [Rhizobium sp. 11515TR]|jgi:NADPH2:quinone reductase|uniref:quinone oxidoreductase family protein n=1 Tax=Rhizobium sp. 11515TR TaxID=2028343 RepID=UPI000BA869A2|nr:quinone oxidoreductase [Rhizobium sp. 11515TR]ASW06579.1 quinone oxidoreductase [Rhizobium sp. 11515TR]
MKKTKVIRIHENGGPEVMKLEEVDLPPPGAGEVQLRHAAIGLNFIDVYFRSGLYKAPQFPLPLGKEAAGTITEVGPGVTDFAVGDRVAYVGSDGAYSVERNIETRHLVKVPDDITLETAASMMLKGMTAEYLLNRTFKVGPGATLLFHAAAGGVGLIAGQWAKALGAGTVIGTAGSAEKVELALAHGYDHVIDYGRENFAERVREITGGKGVDVVYDSVGKDTFPQSLDCLKPRGMWVTFGQSSGPIENFNLAILNQKGSLFATRPSLFAYVGTPEELRASAKALFAVVQSSKVRINIHQTYPLADAGRAHADLEARKTSGTTLLIP